MLKIVFFQKTVLGRIGDWQFLVACRKTLLQNVMEELDNSNNQTPGIQIQTKKKGAAKMVMCQKMGQYLVIEIFCRNSQRALVSFCHSMSVFFLFCFSYAMRFQEFRI